MAAASPKRADQRLNVRIPADLKKAIEDGAAAMGQTVNDFAVSTLYERAQEVLRNRDVTVLSARDRTTLIRLLDGKTAKPNQALRMAASRYKKRLG